MQGPQNRIPNEKKSLSVQSRRPLFLAPLSDTFKEADLVPNDDPHRTEAEIY